MLTNVNIIFNKLIDKKIILSLAFLLIYICFFSIKGVASKTMLFLQDSRIVCPTYISAPFLVCFVKINYLCSFPIIRNLNSFRICTLSK